MPKLDVLLEAAQLVRMQPTPAEIAKVTVLADAVQFVRVDPKVDEKPLVPVLSWTRQDSSTAPGPVWIAIEVHPLTSRSRNLPARAPLLGLTLLIPRAKPLMEPLKRVRRWASAET